MKETDKRTKQVLFHHVNSTQQHPNQNDKKKTIIEMQGPLSQTIVLKELDKFHPTNTTTPSENINALEVINNDFSLYYSAILNNILFTCRCLSSEAQSDLLDDDSFLNINIEGRASTRKKGKIEQQHANDDDDDDDDGITYPISCSFSISSNHLLDEDEGTFTLGSVVKRASDDLKFIMSGISNNDDGNDSSTTSTSAATKQKLQHQQSPRSVEVKFFDPNEEYENQKMNATQKMLQYLASLTTSSSSSSTNGSSFFYFTLLSITISDTSGSTSIDVSPLKQAAMLMMTGSSSSSSSSSSSQLQLEHVQAILSRLKLQFSSRTLKEDISLGNIQESIPTKYCRKCASSGQLDELLNPEFFEQGKKKRNQQQQQQKTENTTNNHHQNENEPELKLKPWYTFSLYQLAEAQARKKANQQLENENYGGHDESPSVKATATTIFTGCLLCHNEYFCDDHKGWKHASTVEDSQNNNKHCHQHIALPIQSQGFKHSNYSEREDLILLMKHTFNSPLLAAVSERFESFRNHPYIVTVSGDEDEDSERQIAMTYQQVWTESWLLAEKMTTTQSVVGNGYNSNNNNNQASKQFHVIVISALRDSPERIVAEFAACFATVALLPLHVLPSSSGESDDIATSKIVQNLIHDVPNQLGSSSVSTVVCVLVHPEHEKLIQEKMKQKNKNVSNVNSGMTWKLVPVSLSKSFHSASDEKDEESSETTSSFLSSPSVPEAFLISRRLYENLRGPVEIVPIDGLLLTGSGGHHQHHLQTPNNGAANAQPSSLSRQQNSKVKIVDPTITTNDLHELDVANLSDPDSEDGGGGDSGGGLSSFGVRKRRSKKNKIIKRLTAAQQEALRVEEEKRRQQEEEIRSRPPILKNIDGEIGIEKYDTELASVAPLLFGLFPTSGSTSTGTTGKNSSQSQTPSLSLSQLASSYLPKLSTYNRNTWLRRLIDGQPPEDSTGLFISLQYAPMFHFSARSAVWDSLFFGGLRCLVFVSGHRGRGDEHSSSPQMNPDKNNNNSSNKKSSGSTTKIISMNDRILSILPMVSPTGVFLVPSLWQRIREQWTFLKKSCQQTDVEIAQDLLGRRALIVGSGTASCPDDLRQWLRFTVARDSCQNIRFKDSYGSTEVGATITSNGVVQEGVLVELDENNIVWVKHQNMHNGYFKDRVSVSSSSSLPSTTANSDNNHQSGGANGLSKVGSMMMMKRRASSITLGRDKTSLEETIAANIEDPLDKCIQEQKRRNAVPRSVLLLEQGYHCTGDYGEWRRDHNKDATSYDSSSSSSSSDISSHQKRIELDPREYRVLVLLGRANGSSSSSLSADDSEVSSSSSAAKLSSGVFCRLDLIEGAAYSVRPRYIRQTFAHVVDGSFVILICYAPTIPSRADLDQLGKEVKQTLVGYANGRGITGDNDDGSGGGGVSLHHHEVPLIVKCVNKVVTLASSTLIINDADSVLFTVDNGLLTASGKIKRNLAAEFLHSEIREATTEALSMLSSSKIRNGGGDDDGGDQHQQQSHQHLDSLTQALNVSKIARDLGVDIRTVKATKHAITSQHQQVKIKNNNLVAQGSLSSMNDDDGGKSADDFDAVIRKNGDKAFESDFRRLAEDLRSWHPCLLKNDKNVISLDAAFVGANCLKPVPVVPSSSVSSSSLSSPRANNINHQHRQHQQNQRPFGILLTGATGHVGAALVVSLLELCVAHTHKNNDNDSSASSVPPSHKKNNNKSRSKRSSIKSSPPAMEIFCLVRHSAHDSSTAAAAVSLQKSKDRLISSLEPYIPDKLKGHLRDAFEKCVKVVPYLSSAEDFAHNDAKIGSLSPTTSLAAGNRAAASSGNKLVKSAENTHISGENDDKKQQKQRIGKSGLLTMKDDSNPSVAVVTSSSTRKSRKQIVPPSSAPKEFGVLISEDEILADENDESERTNKNKSKSSQEEIEQEYETNLKKSILFSLSKFTGDNDEIGNENHYFANQPTPFDVVVHSAAHVDMVQTYKDLRRSNVIFSKVMAEIFASKCKKYILLSTTSVNPLHSSIKHFSNFFSHKDDEEEAEREVALEERRKIEQEILQEAEKRRREEEEKIKARMRKRLRRGGGGGKTSPTNDNNDSSPGHKSPTPPSTPPPTIPSVRTTALATAAMNKFRQIGNNASASPAATVETPEQKKARELEEKKKLKMEHSVPKLPETEAEILAKELMTLAAGGSTKNESAGGTGVSNGGVGSYAITKVVSELVTLAMFNQVRSKLVEEESKTVSAAAKAHIERAKIARKADSYDDIVKQMRSGKGGMTSGGATTTSNFSNHKNNNNFSMMTSVEEQLLQAATLKELPTLAEVEIIRLPFIWCHTETGRSNSKDTFHRFAFSVLESRCVFDPDTLESDLAEANETRANKTEREGKNRASSSSSSLDCFWNFLCVDECASTIIGKIFTASKAQIPPPPPPPLDPSVMTSSPQFLQTFTPRKIPQLQSTIYKVKTSHQLYYRDFVNELKRMSVTTTTTTTTGMTPIAIKKEEQEQNRHYSCSEISSMRLGFQLQVVDYLTWWKKMFDEFDSGKALPILPLVENFSRFHGPYFLKKKLVAAVAVGDENEIIIIERQKRNTCLDILNRNLSWMMNVVYEKK